MPKYYAVKARIALLVDELGEGAPIPTERDLSERFEVARETVRQALRELVLEGTAPGARPRPFARHSGPLPLPRGSDARSGHRLRSGLVLLLMVIRFGAVTVDFDGDSSKPSRPASAPGSRPPAADPTLKRDGPHMWRPRSR
ncbi:hypothetical protein GCM10022420_082670 [Streptomyces iranensis]|uniref:DNA-binding transcriptional MocR family regulator n=1 Tax=Streptomyces iranensis TaxID=576784 RepID=A0ABS4MKJ6_9ACTN|nr:DNA-binding transcriptional MocR family regulator [Streptomyces iranensis]